MERGSGGRLGSVGCGTDGEWKAPTNHQIPDCSPIGLGIQENYDLDLDSVEIRV